MLAQPESRIAHLGVEGAVAPIDECEAALAHLVRVRLRVRLRQRLRLRLRLRLRVGGLEGEG